MCTVLPITPGMGKILGRCRKMKEVAVTGAGIAGGALAGLACGPGAPVCVAIGAFVGGALAAFGTDYFW